MTLYNRDVLASVLASGQPIAAAAGRCTGRTTANVLRAIAYAIENPGSYAAVHYHDNEPRHERVRCMHADLANVMISRLGLKEMRAEVSHEHATVLSLFAERAR